MPYDEAIESRLKRIISHWRNTDQKNMFGGVCYLLNGNMFCGVYQEFLILRLGEENGTRALTLPHVRTFNITGKPMKGWVMVEQEGFHADNDLTSCLN
jgi:hypothetical protein